MVVPEGTRFEVNDIVTDSVIRVATNVGVFVDKGATLQMPLGTESLAGAIIKAIALDERGNVWIGTDHGVFRLTDDEISKFDKNSGLRSTTVAYRAMVVDDANRLWVATSSGVYAWQSASSSPSMSVPPILMSVSIDGMQREVAGNGRIECEYGSFLEVDAVAVSHPADATLYQWRLSDETARWSPPTMDPHITIPETSDRAARPAGTCPADGQTLERAGQFRIQRRATVLPAGMGPAPECGDRCDVRGGSAFRLRTNTMHRRAIEESIRKSEERFRTLVQTTPAAIFIFNGEAFAYANPRTAELTGFTEAELMQKRIQDLIHPADLGMVMGHAVARLRGENAPSRYEFRVRTKGGEVRWLDFSAGLVQHDGRPAIIGTAYYYRP